MMRSKREHDETDELYEVPALEVQEIVILEVGEHEEEESDNQRCRICLNEGELPIFVGKDPEKLCESICKIGGIEVSADDPYPKFLCQSCDKLLKGAIKFRKTAQLSDNRLRKEKAEENLEPTSEIYVDTNPSEHTDHSDLSDYDDDDDTAIKTSVSEHTYHSGQSDFDDTSKKMSISELSDHSDNSDHSYNSDPIYTPEKTNLSEKKKKSRTDDRTKNSNNLKQAAKQVKRRHCTRCDLTFSSFKEYRIHITSTEHENKRIECKICNKTLSHHYYRKHPCVRNPHYKPPITHICDICGKKFTSKTQYSRHQSIHSDDRPYECPYCPYRGRLAQVLKMHIRTHTGEKPYQCTLCPSRFINKGGFNLHMLTHKGMRDFHCETCGKGFYLKRDLELHVKVDHDGIKEFVCGTCGKAFGYRSHLTKHEQRVHKKTKREIAVAARK